MNEFSQVVFDPGLDLAAPRLVEASAGTGKTYNIQNAYLRLVLHAGLKVQQILVVTFTNAATKELRERLRAVLFQCRHLMESPPTGNLPSDQIRIQKAIAMASADADPETLLRRIRVALMDFDGAAIFTIHGFCKRVLDRYAFECGHDPDAELMVEHGGIVREVCQDWWRAHAYRPSTEPVPFANLGELIELVSLAYKNPIARIQGSALPNSPEFCELVSACNAVWPQIGNMRGDIVWTGSGRLCRAKKNSADVSPIAGVARKHADYFARWERSLPQFAETSAHSLAADLAAILRTVRAVPNSGDAKPFAKCLQNVASNAPNSIGLAEKAAAVASIADNLRNRILDRSALTYETMLVNVRNVLRDKTSAPRLRALLREEFKAALIDEFQDTDPIQYEIFWSLFDPKANEGTHPSPLLFVGDPKQAIYGFRGGDVFAYYRAKELIPAEYRHSLGVNYRSEPNLVSAFNAIFRDVNPSTPTFMNPGVPYANDLAAHGLAENKVLCVDGQPDEFPFRIWRLSENPNAMWAPTVAREISSILSDAKLAIGGKRILPSQIAVLVSKHSQAEQVLTALQDAGINAVRQATGNVFDSEDAPRLALIMQAMLEPGRAKIVRSALASGILPCSMEQVARFKAEEDLPPASSSGVPHAPIDSSDPGNLPVRFEDWMELFRDAGRRWESHSFMDGFRLLSSRLNLAAQMARLPDGARRLSDLRHLVELVHRTARSLRLGPVALLGWLAAQLDPSQRDSSGEDDLAKPRISDDDDAVQIMTVFKSKGLQFPIVFVPTLWMGDSVGKRKLDRAFKYHADNEIVLDLDLHSERAKALAKRENHEENVRVAYVALTRAINRVYLFESNGPDDPADNAVAHLLQRLPIPEFGSTVRENHVRREMVSTNSAPAERIVLPQTYPECLRALDLANPVDKKHGHASFSSLSPHGNVRPADASARDVDGGSENPAEIGANAVDPIFSIPGGAKVGDCWHEIFEHIDFRDLNANPDAIRQATNHALDQYRICPVPPEQAPQVKKTAMWERRNAVHAMVANTLSVPLVSGGLVSPFPLCDIPFSSRRSELEFSFSLGTRNERSVGDLAAILDRFWLGPARNDSFIADLKSNSCAIPAGFMTGFMDLAFERNNRFFIADWKSNRINGLPDGFLPAGLASEMQRNSYYLQYMIYVVALHGFLAGQLANYDFNLHFGGVFYLFIRGIDGHSSRGIFYDRPSEELVAALSDFLGGPA